MASLNKLLAFLFSASLPIPLFFYFPNFKFYLENSFVPRSGGALLPICFIPLALLLLINIKRILRILTQGTVFRGVLALFAVSMISVVNGASILFSFQLIAGLFLIYAWPIFTAYFTFNCIWSSLIAASSFALLHLYDKGLIFSDLGQVSLGFYNYPYIYNFFIYHSYVALPEVFAVIFSSGVAFYLHSHTSARSIGSMSKLIMSVFILIYSISYARAATSFSILVALISLIIIYLLPSSMNLKLRLSRIKSFVYAVFGSVLVLICFPLASSLFSAASQRFLQRAVDEGGSDRLDIWKPFLESFLNSEPSVFFFGSNSSAGAHNLLLDMLGRVGIFGLCAFVFALFVGMLVILRNLGDSGFVFFPPNVAFVLFISFVSVGNIFNVSLTQPWCIASYLYFWSVLRLCSSSKNSVLNM